MLSSLARWARPILLTTASLLTLGASLIVFDLPDMGWAVYAIGHVAGLLAFPAAAQVHRARMDQLSWWALGVLLIALVLVLPAAFLNVVPILAGIVAWVALGLFGLATWRVHAIATPASVLFVLAALLGLTTELGWFSVLGWAGAVILAAFGLVWIASGIEQDTPRA